MIQVETTKIVRTKMGSSGTLGELKAAHGPNGRIEITVYHLNGETTALDIQEGALEDFIAVLAEFRD